MSKVDNENDLTEESSEKIQKETGICSKKCALITLGIVMIFIVLFVIGWLLLPLTYQPAEDSVNPVNGDDNITYSSAQSLNSEVNKTNTNLTVPNNGSSSLRRTSDENINKTAGNGDFSDVFEFLGNNSKRHLQIPKFNISQTESPDSMNPPDVNVDADDNKKNKPKSRQSAIDEIYSKLHKSKSEPNLSLTAKTFDDQLQNKLWNSDPNIFSKLNANFDPLKNFNFNLKPPNFDLTNLKPNIPDFDFKLKPKVPKFRFRG
ncbi:hypothetical protein CHUAL_010571 [Chamberlinius hualienensis]